MESKAKIWLSRSMRGISQIAEKKSPESAIITTNIQKGGKMMRKVLEMIARIIRNYGVASAGMASFRGSYEAQPPLQLREQPKE